MRAPLDRSDPGPKVARHQAEGEGLTRVPFPIRVRDLAVLRREEAGPAVLRLVLGGPGLAGFHTYQCDDHVKIIFPDPDGAFRPPVPGENDMLAWPHPLPPTRRYTVRRHDPAAGELWLDVVRHGTGLAAGWAETVAVGETVTVAGPPGALTFPHHHEHYVLAVDATGLPAAARWLEDAPAGPTADVVVEAASEDELAYPLPERDGVRVHRWVRPADGSRLAETVAGLDRPAGRTFVFAAGEAGDVAPLRRALRSGRGRDGLVTGYWKRGTADFDDD